MQKYRHLVPLIQELNVEIPETMKVFKQLH